MKLTSLAELGEVYSKILASSNEQQDLVNEAVKPGSPLGGGPGTKKNEVPLSSKTGPQGLKGNNFQEVTTKEDPGSDEEVMKKEIEGKEESSENAHQDDAAKFTTPKEKVEDLVAEKHKYNYKPKFTMSKSSFDKLYMEALKRAPFTEEANTEMEEAGVMPADDVAADAPEVTADVDVGGEEETVTISIPKDVAQKLHDLLMAQLDTAVDKAEDDLVSDVDDVEDVVAEEVEAEDEGHPIHNMKKGKPDSPKGSNQVGDLKAVKHSVEKGSPKSEPTPKEEKGDNAKLQGKSNKVGSGTVASPGKKMFE